MVTILTGILTEVDIFSLCVVRSLVLVVVSLNCVFTLYIYFSRWIALRKCDLQLASSRRGTPRVVVCGADDDGFSAV